MDISNSDTLIADTLIYDTLGDNSVRCGICNHYCVIADGKKGRCAVRKNIRGKLVSLVYPKIIAASIDPIEKKPIFHLKPGSLSYSVASPGCNFQCSFCQNASIAQVPEDETMMMRQTRAVLPEAIVSAALENGCQSIAYTYTEPTVFLELALETAKLAKKKGLLNIFVTNGYMTPKALDLVLPYLDAANVDLKAFNDDFYKKYCKARLEPVKANLKKMKDAGVLLEITTLLIPGLNDHPVEIQAMARYIADELGNDTPWHISRFHPCHKMTDRESTPVSSLETAHDAGKSAGLRYVYVGNVPGLKKENTYCHSCGSVLIKRYAYQIESHLKKNGMCPECGIKAFGQY